MTYADVSAMIQSIGLPFAYDHFEGTDQAPPFIAYIYTGNDDLAADNRNYQKIKSLQIELYTDNKDFALEEAVEAVLSGYELYYSEEEGYLSDEQMYMHTYTMEVVING